MISDVVVSADVLSINTGVTQMWPHPDLRLRHREAHACPAGGAVTGTVFIGSSAVATVSAGLEAGLERLDGGAAKDCVTDLAFVALDRATGRLVQGGIKGLSQAERSALEGIVGVFFDDMGDS